MGDSGQTRPISLLNSNGGKRALTKVKAGKPEAAGEEHELGPD